MLRVFYAANGEKGDFVALFPLMDYNGHKKRKGSGKMSKSPRGGTLSERIYAAVMRIPRGKVATYGLIASQVGSPRLARAVGGALHRNPAFGVIPCHRVVFSDGRLSDAFAFGGAEAQKNLLESEGVQVTDGRVDLAKYLMEPAEGGTSGETNE